MVAIVAAAAAIVMMHNYPSGEPRPSEADINVTRHLIRAGQIVKIEVLDHIIIGKQKNATTTTHMRKGWGDVWTWTALDAEKADIFKETLI